MKNYILVFALAFVSLATRAQVKTITGTVTDATGPLPGVSILVKGTANGTQTDFDGKYAIKASTGDVLVFAYIGYTSEQIVVKDKEFIHVELKEDAQALEEVVVVGYGTTTTRSITSSLISVNSESLIKKEKANAYHNSISQQLQGRAAGVQITNTSRNTGATHNIEIRGNSSLVNFKRQNKTNAIVRASPEIKIRGAATINTNEQPLYIVDGVPIQAINNAVVANLDPKTIDKINVYKGVKARKIFGSSAKNGCVVITTKKGTYQIDYDEQYAQITENKFEKVNLNPLSTFSIDVDKAGYSNIRRLINNGSQVPIDAVKIEEMVNYFDYQYPQPKDEHPFSINLEAAETPWNNDTQLVRIGLQGKSYLNEELPASNLTFLIDVSGSMNNQNKLPLLKSAFKLLVHQLREKDKVAIVVYAGAAGVVLEPTSGNQKEKIINALDNLQAGGSTAGGQGIELAYQLADKNFKANKNNRVILATDGDFNVGASSDKDMEILIEEKRKSGVFLSVLGFGMGNYKDSKLEKLADKGNGNHAYIDTMQEAQKVFGKEFGGTFFTIAKDVKIQIEFNPTKVQGYRLIGYENRLLADEDFVDDTKDAGELGSGHTVTALYEIIPIGVKSDYLKEVADLKYTDKTTKTEFSDELFTVKFRYKKPNEDKSIEMVEVYKNSETQMSSDFKFASSVALFGMHLRKSQYLNNSNLNDVLALASEGKGNDNEGYRAEFIRLVKTADTSL
ncbi:MAG: von Willebrand factor type A domain-containing protein [Cellulophaga sp.]|nr:von Willebrand factor type A domain-containing protein [Cellulophaga sp.]